MTPRLPEDDCFLEPDDVQDVRGTVQEVQGVQGTIQEVQGVQGTIQDIMQDMLRIVQLMAQGGAMRAEMQAETQAETQETHPVITVERFQEEMRTAETQPGRMLVERYMRRTNMDNGVNVGYLAIDVESSLTLPELINRIIQGVSDIELQAVVAHYQRFYLVLGHDILYTQEFSTVTAVPDDCVERVVTHLASMVRL